MNSGTTMLLAALAALAFAAEAGARPENVRPGHSYYSDAQSATGLVHDIVGEMNVEEVYQFHRYCEAVADRTFKLRFRSMSGYGLGDHPKTGHTEPSGAG